MSLTDVSQVLFDGMMTALDSWADKYGGERYPLYWLLRVKAAQIEADEARAVNEIPSEIRDQVLELRNRADEYWSDVRYASLEPVTMLWGTVVNSVRVAAQSDRATDSQKQVFDVSTESLMTFFHAVRDRMEVADHLYHAFKAMPAPECQALAALLNVHVDARIDENSMCRLVRLLDHEGPMSEEEHRDLATLSNTRLVNAAFSGLRAHA